jgi:hypothetical protein
LNGVEHNLYTEGLLQQFVKFLRVEGGRFLQSGNVTQVQIAHELGLNEAAGSPWKKKPAGAKRQRIASHQEARQRAARG